MGFGILFVGYFLLLNITFFEFTDLLSALVMLIGLYKLSYLNRGFRLASRIAGFFAAYGLLELAARVVGMLGVFTLPDVYYSYFAILRYGVLCMLTVSLFVGVRDVAAEVGAKAVTGGAKRELLLSPIAFLLTTLFEIPELGDLLGGITAYLSVAALLFLIAVLIMNLYVLFRAYAGICMPEDAELEIAENEKSAFDRHSEKAAREYAEYKLERAKAKAGKKKKK